jgi:uncharacterized protein (TIGR01777 family)
MNGTKRRVVVAGGTGLVGRALVRELGRWGYDVTVVSRRPAGTRLLDWVRTTTWDEPQVDGALAVVNLAGESIGGRWTDERKQRILESRVGTTRTLVDAIAAAAQPPDVFVCASGIDYAGDSGETLVDESVPAGDSFLARVCVAWEAEAARAPVRHVELRTPFVVARDAHALKLLARPFRLFAGGRLGSGRQWFPWIHIDDLVALVRRAIEDEEITGPLNAVAPDLRRQREFARELGRTLRRPSLVPAPAPALRLLLGEQADLLLHGQRAVPSVELDYRYGDLRAALEEALA